MSAPDNLIANLTAAWAGDLDLLLAQYDPDCTFEDKAFGIAHHGHAGLREVFGFTFTMMPDFRVSYGNTALGADAGAAEWTFTGSFHGEFGEKQHTGTPVRIEGVSFMTFRDGRIATNTDYWNVKSLEQQLGAG
ncbi:MAG: ester cyclase [Pseudomonadota bacterium]